MHLCLWFWICCWDRPNNWSPHPQSPQSPWPGRRAPSDTGSGVSTCTLKVTKPGGTVVDLSCGSEQELGATTTNEAGSYTLECKVTDRAARTSTKTATFTALYSAAGGGGAGGAGGGGTTREAPVEVPEGVTRNLGTLTSAETFTTLVRNSKVTFTVAESSHTATVLEVTVDSATIEISSTPSQFTLNIGESQEVDVDDNGVNDLVVTLSSVTNSKADLVFKTIEEAAPTEEVPTGEEVPGVVTGEEARPSLTWLWVVIVIVVVILLIWYFSRRKR